MEHSTESSAENRKSSAATDDRGAYRRAADEVSELVVWAHRRAEADFRANRLKTYAAVALAVAAFAFAWMRTDVSPSGGALSPTIEQLRLAKSEIDDAASSIRKLTAENTELREQLAALKKETSDRDSALQGDTSKLLTFVETMTKQGGSLDARYVTREAFDRAIAEVGSTSISPGHPSTNLIKTPGNTASAPKVSPAANRPPPQPAPNPAAQGTVVPASTLP